ncbi:MAG: L-2-hydroxyglutarate oxidase [Deltaproteobacteria bacterium]|nr:L-2-hydroxyglutarate oxidase [Deltaproteobacteria bacterium]
MASSWDLAVVGGGIVGLATAMKLAEKYPHLRLLLLEKEQEIARHQSGHNSGVIHSGIYYKPGSVKAQTCVAGRKALLEFCDANAIPYELCGKVIVAARPDETARLEELYRRGQANGVAGLELIGPERLQEIEPYCRGIRALHAPTTGIIDFTRVAKAYAARFQTLGGEIQTSQEVRKIVPERDGLVIESSGGTFHAKRLINCAGLFSDKLAGLMARTVGESDRLEVDLRIIPFRGEYFRLVAERRFLVRGLIYPVPDPRFPFLGAHFTRTVKGDVEVGPNAVLALAREGYRKTDFDPSHAFEVFSYRGFWLLALHYWRMGVTEMHRSFSKRAFVKALQQLIPEVRVEDFVPSGAGVRAQAVSASGALIDDFVIRRMGNAINVLNAPSPGATASLAIGEKIVQMAAENFSLNA